MIKISAHIARKSPGTEPYSSVQFGASMEIELSDADTPANVKQKVREIYNLLDSTIQEQVSGQHIQTGKRPAISNRLPAAPVHSANGHKNGSAPSRKVLASEAQQKCIVAICKRLGIEVAEAVRDHGVASPALLTMSAASVVIDGLKRREASN